MHDINKLPLSKATSNPGTVYITWQKNLFNLPASFIYFLLSILLFFINLLCIPREKYAEIQNRSQEKETLRRLEDIGDFIKEGETVLDVGCGNGRFGENIARKFNACVTGIDVVDYADAGIPIKFYDGYTIPFDDNSFDVIIMAFMLHHVKHQDVIFKEALRCSKSKIIIYEDTYFSPWQHLFIMWNDFHSNMIVGLVKIVKGLEGKGILGMPLPFTFRSVKGWYRYFQENNLEIISTQVSHSNFKPMSKVTFLLQKGTRTE
ncbi:class I SAM-dependent methyltransferase [Emcibacter sp.]|uniref:class I SAM-dependent methyltransferase n=1 Tax=Emcibacter sp. TaxID=1979954 RepID=UPI002AA5EC79|nr:class I SAM-dependent methyltransferase [Emcibacter sp.]